MTRLLQLLKKASLVPFPFKDVSIGPLSTLDGDTVDHMPLFRQETVFLQVTLYKSGNFSNALLLLLLLLLVRQALVGLELTV